MAPSAGWFGNCLPPRRVARQQRAGVEAGLPPEPEMPERRIVIECPLCRCRMEVPREGGAAEYTCRNGHRFLHRLPRRPSRRFQRAQVKMIILFALTLALALVIAFALAAHHWPSPIPFMRIE